RPPSLKRWAVELFFLSSIQIILFAGSLGLAFKIMGVNYKYALVIGAPFFATLVVLNNTLLLLARKPWVKRAVTLATFVLHCIVWAEDLNNYLFVSALTGILIGGILIYARKWIIARLNWLMPQSTR
ncbi:MAG TPA: hypothetical protein PL070_08420, partial [Flavobacteriales bacterium]|nr:hypothetical protein [Flavobacteriales bacterium]